MPIRYMPPSLILSSALTTTHLHNISISALPPTLLAPTSTQKTNHWHLIIANSETSYISLYPNPDTNDLLNLTVSQGRPAESVKITRLSSVAESVTAAGIIEELKKAGHEYYKFDEGHGCRHWLITSLAVLRAKGILLDDLDVEGAKEALKKVWGDNGELLEENEQSEVVVGTFL